MKNEDIKKDPKLTPHPIQLLHLGVKGLYIRSNRPPDMNTTINPEDPTIKISTSPYDEKQKKIAVSITLETGMDTKKTQAPYAMKIELVGIFTVDEARFAPKNVPDWAKRGAPMILFPYLREHAFGLSSRCGFKPLLLPLLEVPTFKIDKPKRKKATTSM